MNNTRVLTAKGKRDPLDCPLESRRRQSLDARPSPWGPLSGMASECSESTKYLGEKFDIHGVEWTCSPTTNVKLPRMSEPQAVSAL